MSMLGVEATTGNVHSARRGSSGESHESAPSDPRGWFDRSNRNLGSASFDDVADMDIDPPFFQKPLDSSPAFPIQPTVTHSSSADDYRSVIDDLTIENKRLKEELKRYKQFGPDMMRKEKLFEIKVHGLPKRKKRELEATLREFAASLKDSSESPPQRKKQGKHGNLYSSGESMSKHASSSSSRSRPVDSAYASMSTGPSSHAPNSSKASLGRPSMGSRARTSEQKVEDYLRDTPDGLFPRHMVMTDKERKKLVVRRLEQLFTGKMGGKHAPSAQPMASEAKSASDTVLIMAPPPTTEASREACILPNDPSRKKTRSRDNGSSNSNGDQTESGGNGRGSGDGGGSGGRSGNNASPPTLPLPEQRPTRPKDLDPDRVQVPSENLNYIRHLGLVPQEFIIDDEVKEMNVSIDADGWVYLNLLCNLAQLHMLNATPNFIRLAVTEKSTKFQLSPDGRKIRWRGGTDGTKFSSDSSGDNSRRNSSGDDTDGSNQNGQRKKAKTQAGSGGAKTSGTSSKNSKLGPQASTLSDSFHYKPMFIHQSSSIETSLEGTGSQGSDGAIDDSNPGNASKWDYSGSGSSQRKKRRRDGAIVYYSGAPFCIDLSGDPGDASPTTYMTSTGQEVESDQGDLARLLVHRTMSGSSLPVRPLSDQPSVVAEVLGPNHDSLPELDEDDDDVGSMDDSSEDFPWCDDPSQAQSWPMDSAFEASGLGGVLPEDHFAVTVVTRRTIGLPTADSRDRIERSTSVSSAEAIGDRLASLRTSSPLPPRKVSADEKPVKMRYMSFKTRRMDPAPLPPPATFIPPFSTDTEGDSDESASDSDEAVNSEDPESESLISRRANPHLSDNTDVGNDALMSEGEVDVVGEKEDDLTSEGSFDIKPLRAHVAQREAGGDHRPELLPTGSSVATAGGAESGYSSSMEEDARP